MEQVTRYLHVSDKTYRTSEGDRVALVYATRTATLAALPRPVVDLLEAGEAARIPEEFREDLRAAEILVDDAVPERVTVLDRQREASADERRLRYILLPSSYCNMGCGYCGQEHLRRQLAPEHRDAVAERVLNGMARPTTEAVRVSWFGGEPMIGYPIIRALSERFTARADELGIGFDAAIVTNGSLLTIEKMQVLVNECRVRRFDITLDGPARIHDVHRPLKQGGGSYDYITKLLQEALAREDLRDFDLVLRCNVDLQNVEWVEEHLTNLAAMGFDDDRVFINIAPVYSWGNDVSTVELERGNFARHELDWFRTMMRLGLHFDALPVTPVEALCAAVSRSSEVVSSTGTVFSCSEYPLVPEHESGGGLGTVRSLPILAKRPSGPFDDWHDAVENGETPCHSCRLLPVCGGSCPKQWREGNRACPPYKYGMSERFDVIAELNELEPVP